MVRPRRGEIWWADLDPVVGSEPGGRRPVIIVQNDVGNQSASTTIVVPVSAQRGKAHYKVNIALAPGPLPLPSLAKCSHVRVLDLSRLTGGPIGKVDSETMARIERGLLVALGVY